MSGDSPTSFKRHNPTSEHLGFYLSDMAIPFADTKPAKATKYALIPKLRGNLGLTEDRIGRDSRP